MGDMQEIISAIPEMSQNLELDTDVKYFLRGASLNSLKAPSVRRWGVGEHTSLRASY